MPTLPVLAFTNKLLAPTEKLPDKIMLLVDMPWEALTALEPVFT